MLLLPTWEVVGAEISVKGGEETYNICWRSSSSISATQLSS